MDAAKIVLYVGLAIYVIAAIRVITGMVTGWKRGTVRQTLRFVTVAASGVGAFFLTKFCYDKAYAFCEGKTLWEILEATKITTVFKISADTQTAIQNMDAATSETLIPLILSFLLMPFVFVTIFLLLKWLSIIVYAIFAGIAGLQKKKHSDVDGLVGSLIGGIQSAAVALVLLIPLAGLLSFSAEAAETLKENDPDSPLTEKVVSLQETYLDGIHENKLVQFSYDWGGRQLCDYFATVTVEGEETNMREESLAFVRLVAKVSVLTEEEIDFTAPTESQKAALNAIVADLGDNRYIASLFSGVLRGVSVMLEDKIDGKVEEPLATLFTSLTEVMQTSNADTLKGDLTTIKNLYFLLADSGVLAAMDGGDADIQQLLTETDENGKTIISRAISELNANERTASITAALNDITFAILLGNTDMDEETLQQVKQAKEEVMGAMNEILAYNEEDYETHEEYVDAIAGTIDDTLKNNGIELDAEVLNQVAEYAADENNFTDSEGNRLTEMDDAALTELLLSYYDAYAAEQAGE